VLFGAVSTGVMLYGFSLLYGLTGTTSIPALRELLAGGLVPEARSTLVLVSLMVLAGFGFKTASVPFHFWCPDVYQGAATPVTAFLSVAPKAAGFAIMLRFFFSGLSTKGSGGWDLAWTVDWVQILMVVSVATMTVGNVAALTQTNMKRLLAYSSIAHAGYALLGVLGFRTEWGLKGILVYLAAYTFMNFGAFALVILLETRGYAAESVSDFNGLAKRNMPAAIVMLIFLLSLAGIPPTAGFIGKYYLFTAAMKAGYTWLAVLAVIASAVSLFYYFRIAQAMFLSDETGGAKLFPSYGLTAAVAVCAAGTLILGLAPEPVLELLSKCVP
jgi:NADH-quinone oxidoreductase subunit N